MANTNMVTASSFLSFTSKSDMKKLMNKVNAEIEQYIGEDNVITVYFDSQSRLFGKNLRAYILYKGPVKGNDSLKRW